MKHKWEAITYTRFIDHKSLIEEILFKCTCGHRHLVKIPKFEHECLTKTSS
jgi:hypothetical protein